MTETTNSTSQQAAWARRWRSPVAWGASAAAFASIIVATYFWHKATDQIRKRYSEEQSIVRAMTVIEHAHSAVHDCGRLERDLIRNAGNVDQRDEHYRKWHEALTAARKALAEIGPGLPGLSDRVSGWTADLDRYAAAMTSAVNRRTGEASSKPETIIAALETAADPIRAMVDDFESAIPTIQTRVAVQSAATAELIGQLDTRRWTLTGIVGGLLILAGWSWIWGLRGITAELALEKQAATLALREAQALRHTIDQAAIVSTADPRGRIREVNEMFCRISGYSAGELIGQDHRIVNSGHHPKSFWVDMWRTVAAGKLWRSEVCNRAKNGSHYWMDTIIAPFKDADGDIEKYVSIRIDITERKRAEEQLLHTSRRLQQVLDTTSDGIYGVGLDGRCTFINRAALAMLGYDRPEEVLGRNSHDLFHHSHKDGSPYPIEECPIFQTMKGRPPKLVATEVFWRKDGTSVPVEYEAHPLMNGEDVLGCVVTLTDITERKQAEDELRLRAAYATLEAEVGTLLTRPLPFEEAVQRCAEAIVKHLDAAFARVWTLDHATNTLELRASAGLYTHLDGPHSRVPVGKFKIGLIAQEKEPHLTNQVVGDPRVGDQEWAKREGMVSFAGYPLIVDQRVEGVLAMFARAELPPRTLEVLSNLARALALAIGRQRAENELRQAARTDKLTSLPNRALLCDRLQKILQRAQSDPQYRFGVLFLDFDRFKIVNDSLGHAAGDMLLRQIAERLRSAVRPGDSLSRQAIGNTAARIGGDEFVLLLDDLSSTADAVIVADRLLGILSEPYLLGDHEIYSTASIGIVTSDIAAHSADEVLQNADIAMYEAKLAGKARCVVFDTSMHERVRRRHELENDLRVALESGQIGVMFQPIVNLATGRLASFEALARWNHPTRGPISPVEFIPIAEETGLIVPLGQFVLEKACAFLERLTTLPGGEALCINVNLSRRQLVQSGFVSTLQSFLSRLSVSPDRLRLEITESALINAPETVREALEQIRSLGVHIHLDDFGTGLSSLSLLRTLPVDGLKVDRGFIDAAEGDRRAIAVLHGIISLGRNLGKLITAEGISEKSQVATALALECDLVQGFLFGRPTTAAEAEAWLQTDFTSSCVEQMGRANEQSKSPGHVSTAAVETVGSGSA